MKKILVFGVFLFLILIFPSYQVYFYSKALNQYEKLFAKNESCNIFFEAKDKDKNQYEKLLSNMNAVMESPLFKNISIINKPENFFKRANIQARLNHMTDMLSDAEVAFNKDSTNDVYKFQVSFAKLIKFLSIVKRCRSIPDLASMSDQTLKDKINILSYYSVFENFDYTENSHSESCNNILMMGFDNALLKKIFEPDIYLYLFNHYSMEKNHEAAIKILEKAKINNVGENDALYKRNLILNLSGQYMVTEQVDKAAATLMPLEHFENICFKCDYYYRQAFIEFIKGEYSKAEKILNIIFEINKKPDIKTYEILAMTLFHQKKHMEAKEAVNKRLKEDSFFDGPNSYFYIYGAMILLKTGDTKNAYELFNKGIKLNYATYTFLSERQEHIILDNIKNDVKNMLEEFKLNQLITNIDLSMNEFLKIWEKKPGYYP